MDALWSRMRSPHCRTSAASPATGFAAAPVASARTTPSLNIAAPLRAQVQSETLPSPQGILFLHITLYLTSWSLHFDNIYLEVGRGHRLVLVVGWHESMVGAKKC